MYFWSICLLFRLREIANKSVFGEEDNYSLDFLRVRKVSATIKIITITAMKASNIISIFKEYCFVDVF